MDREGPDLAILARRLSEAPPDVLADAPAPLVAAVVSDALRDMGGPGLSASQAAALVPGEVGPSGHNQRAWLLLGAWLLREPSLRLSSAPGTGQSATRAREWMASDLKALAHILPAPTALADADRREEIARRALAALGMRPRGESISQAQDRLRTLDSIERQRVILESRRAQERAREIREEMARKAAEEAASRYGRE